MAAPVAARGITINGPVILNEEPTLDDYSRANVIAGAELCHDDHGFPLLRPGHPR